MTSDLEQEFLEEAYGAVNDETGLATSVVFNTYPSMSINTDDSTVTLGTAVPYTVNVSPPAKVLREFVSDGKAITRETGLVFLPAWDGSAVLSFTPEQTIKSHQTVTWDGKTRNILAVDEARIGETVVGWKVYTEV